MWSLGVYLGLWWLGLVGLAVLVAQTAWWGSLWGVVLLLCVSILWTPQVWPVAWPGWTVFVAMAGNILAPLAIIRQATARERHPAHDHAPSGGGAPGRGPSTFVSEPVSGEARADQPPP
ncbi:MAG: hypothetical protein EA378_10745 [Phycisphaerales bacterium]|nr:MAG: hypothetical protein EA378_10745 [Phycisphaerales bacterium]